MGCRSTSGRADQLSRVSPSGTNNEYLHSLDSELNAATLREVLLMNVRVGGWAERSRPVIKTSEFQCQDPSGASGFVTVQRTISILLWRPFAFLPT